MKTRLFLITLILGLSMVSLNGTASNRAKEAKSAFSFENVTEQDLMLENWMVNDCYWRCLENNCLSRDYDEAMHLEAWMTDRANFDLAVLLPVEKEKELQIESWMTCEKNWTNSKSAGNGKECGGLASEK